MNETRKRNVRFLLQWGLVALLIYKILGEAGPWSAASFGVLFVVVNLRLSRVLEELGEARRAAHRAALSVLARDEPSAEGIRAAEHYLGRNLH